MNKLFNKIAASIVGIAMAVGVGVAVGSQRSDVRSVKAEEQTVSWAGTTALPGTATSIGSSPITIMTSSTNSYTNPIRVYANTTITISATDGASIKSVTYVASSTGNYVTYAQNAEVSPNVTPTVSGKNVTWSFSSGTDNFTFKPSAQTRASSISVTYEKGSTTTPTITLDKQSLTVLVGSDDTFTVTSSNLTDNFTITGATSDFTLSYTASKNDTQTVTVTGNSATNATVTLTVSSGTASATIDINVKAVLTIAQARAAIDAGTGVEGVYAKGIVTTAYAYNTRYKNITFFLSDDGTATNDLEAYRCSSASDPDIKAGDVVVVFGDLAKHNTTYEFAEGCTIISSDKISELSVKTAPTKVDYDSGDPFEADGLIVTASYAGGEPDHDFAYSSNAAYFELDPNDGDELSSLDTSVSIKYGHGSTTQAITVTTAPTVLSVTLNPSSKRIAFDGEFTISATVTVDGGASQDVTWSVDDSSTLVSVKSSTTSSAVIKANSSTTGTAVIRATSTADSSKSATCTVTVINPDALTDTLTYDLIGVSGTSYRAWSDVSDATSAIYCGTTAGGNNAIQLNDGSNRGIRNIASAGYVRSIQITFNENTASGRTVAVYGYAEAQETNTTSGTSLGTASYDGTNVEVTINIPEELEFEYFVLVSDSGAIYLDEIVITYEAIDTDPSIMIIGSTSLTEIEGTSDSTSTSVKVKNIASPVFTFTFDEDGKTDQSSSSHVRVSTGSPTDGIYPLIIHFDNAGSTTIKIDVSGQKATISVKVVEAAYLNATLTAQYRQVFDASTLQAGDQIVIADNNSDNTKDKIMNTTIGKYAGASEVSFTNSYISSGDLSDGMVITLGGESGAWTLKYGESDYLAANSSKNFVGGTASDTWTISIVDGNATIQYMESTYGYIMHNVTSTRFKPYTSTPDAGMRLPQIYRYVSGDKQVEIGSDLLSAVSSAESAFTCDAQGTSFNAANFNAMSSYFNSALVCKYYLDFANSKDTIDGGNLVENFLARYDYVMGKKAAGYSAYANAEDFLGRVSSGKLPAQSSGRISIFGSTPEQTNNIMIIAIISAISVTAIGGYFFLRKKKEK